MAAIKNTDKYGLFILTSLTSDDPAETEEPEDGVTGIWIQNVEQIQEGGNYTVEVEPFLKGAGFNYTQGEGLDNYKITARYSGTGESDRMDKKAALMRLFKNNLGNALYMAIRKRGDVWEPFYDALDNKKKYMRGTFKDEPQMNRNSKQLYYEIKIVWQGYW